MRARIWFVPVVLGLACSFGSAVRAQVRIGEWNITNWVSSDATGARGPAFKSSLYGVNPANGLQFAPDILVAEEITQGGTGNTGAHQTAGQAGVVAFVGVLNSAPGSPGDWTGVTYMANGGDTGNALFYRTSKFTWVSTTALTANTGTGANQAPRDTQRWRMRIVGFAGPGAELYIYGSHFKAGSAGSDQARRDPEAVRIRADSDALPAGIGGFLIGVDTNMQSSSQAAYQTMTSGVSAGRFFDPINSPGNWNNNAAFQYIHTQEPATQMDDRHDQLLVSGTLLDHQGLSYIFNGPAGSPPVFSTSTWNDPNHTYRCWGNDGGHFNTTIVSGGVNNQVGLTIANDLITTVSGNGHLPEYLDMQVPAKLGAPVANSTIDFGTVQLNASAQQTLLITNAADVPRFSKTGTGSGIDALTYSLAASGGFTAPAGTFDRTATAAPAQADSRTITMDTGTPGQKAGTLTITSDDPDNPTRVIQLTGLVQSGVQPDYDVNNDGLLNTEDIISWLLVQPTDVDGNGTVNDADLAALIAYLRQNEIPDITAGRR